jgi:hypothetical protein
MGAGRTEVARCLFGVDTSSLRASPLGLFQVEARWTRRKPQKFDNVRVSPIDGVREEDPILL